MLTPVFGADGQSQPAVVAADVSYDVPLWDSFPQSVGGSMDVVFSNTCDQSFIYRISKDDVHLLATDDGESTPVSNRLSVSMSLEPDEVNSAVRDPRHCRYTMVSSM